MTAEWIKCPHCGQSVARGEIRKCPMLMMARTDHRAIPLRQKHGPTLCETCWSVVRTATFGERVLTVHAEPRDPRPPVLS